MKTNKVISLFLVGIMLVSSGFLSACRDKNASAKKTQTVELVYYKLFDNEDIMAPLIQEFQSQYKYIKIKYKKFTDDEEYENLILNELAEGEGPDIFEIHNTWLPKHKRKLTPMPADIMAVQNFKETFVNVATQDLIAPDEQGQSQIYGIPLTVDTLGLYYNKSIYEDKVPSRGKPGETWEEIKEDVSKINTPDLSKERFAIAGIAMGRSDNILRAVDILYMLFLQNDTQLYNKDYKEAIFADQQGISTLGRPNYPGIEALDLYTSFSMPSNKHYSWNAYLSDKNSKEQELAPFVTRKTAMIIGYSYLYESLQNLIKTYENKNISTIKLKDIGIAPIPQIQDPNKYPKSTYASYFAQTVARTSKHPREAWKFIQFLASKENQIYYNQKTHKPTSRRDLIEEQSKDPNYGVFASQIGSAKSLIILDENVYKNIFESAIQAVNNTELPKEALKAAQNEINKLIPENGILPNLTPVNDKN